MSHVDGYSQPGAGTARSGSSFNRTSPDYSRELVGSANMIEFTTLEKCRNQAMDNMSTINDIGSRIAGLLDRLRGHGSLIGGKADGDSEPRGMLVVHHEQLEYEAQRLGEIQADLAELERLL